MFVPWRSQKSLRKHKDLLLATHSLMMYDRAVSRCEQRGCQSFHWLVFFGEAIKHDTNFFSQDHEAILGLRSQSSEIL